MTKWQARYAETLMQRLILGSNWYIDENHVRILLCRVVKMGCYCFTCLIVLRGKERIRSPNKPLHDKHNEYQLRFAVDLPCSKLHRSVQQPLFPFRLQRLSCILSVIRHASHFAANHGDAQLEAFVVQAWFAENPTPNLAYVVQRMVLEAMLKEHRFPQRQICEMSYYACSDLMTQQQYLDRQGSVGRTVSSQMI